MKEKNTVMESLVMLMLCPRSRGDDPCCEKCSCKLVPANMCYNALRAQCLDSLSGSTATTAKDERVDLEKQATIVLHHLGTPSSLIGYRYIREAIVLTVQDENYLHAITKDLYPTIAKKFGTTSSRVERAIRHGIEVTWDRGDLDTFLRYFGNTVSLTKCKPTNSEFLGLLADGIKQGIFDDLFT